MSARQNKHVHRSERSLFTTIHHRFEFEIPYTNSGEALVENRRMMHMEIKKKDGTWLRRQYHPKTASR